MNKESFFQKRKFLLIGLLIVSIPFWPTLLSGNPSVTFESITSLFLTIFFGAVFIAPFVVLWKLMKRTRKK